MSHSGSSRLVGVQAVRKLKTVQDLRHWYDSAKDKADCDDQFLRWRNLISLTLDLCNKIEFAAYPNKQGCGEEATQLAQERYDPDQLPQAQRVLDQHVLASICKWLNKVLMGTDVGYKSDYPLVEKKAVRVQARCGFVELSHPNSYLGCSRYVVADMQSN